MTDMKHTPWKVVHSKNDPEMYAVEGAYLVADKLPIEDAIIIAAAPDLLRQAKKALESAENWIHDQLDGTKAFYAAWEELDSVRAAIAKAEG